MPLHLDYRPASLDDLVENPDKEGNADALKSELRSLVAKKDRPHAYLLTGPSGCGKTTIARILAGMFGCTGMDLKEVDSADFRGIDTIRELRRLSSLRPISGGARGFIIDEVHQTSKDAQEALLKALEDTPSHVYYFLCTTEPGKLKDTLVNRCTPYSVTPLRDDVMVRHLHRVCKKEGKRVPMEVLEAIAADSLGSPRAAMVVLDKIIDLPPEKMAVAAHQVAAQQNEIIELSRALIQRAKWKTISKILKGLNQQEAEKTRISVLNYASKVLLDGDAQAALVIECFKETIFNAGFAGIVHACWEVVRED